MFEIFAQILSPVLHHEAFRRYLQSQVPAATYYSIAHFYAKKAAASGGNKEYVEKAIEIFKAALNADPSIPVTDEELSGVYKRRLVPLHLPQGSPSNPK